MNEDIVIGLLWGIGGITFMLVLFIPFWLPEILEILDRRSTRKHEYRMTKLRNK